MPRCLDYRNDYTDPNDGTVFAIFADLNETPEQCGTNGISDQVALTLSEYTNLTDRAGEAGTLAQAIAVLDPVEVASVYGASFALVVTICAAAWKIRIAKTFIKLA